MTTEVQLERLEEACKAIVLVQKAGQAMRAFGRIAMPDSPSADELLAGVTRSEVASVLEFFGGLIDENAALAYEFVCRVGIDADKALAPARASTSAQAA